MNCKQSDILKLLGMFFSYHPHGLISVGALANFATEATDFSKIFPGLTSHLLILGGQFLLPFRREYLMALGCCTSTKRSMEYLLKLNTKGHALVIVVGGPLEALGANPGECNVLLKERKGFIKMALRYGTDLVPVFTFGENDLFTQFQFAEGSFLRKVQSKLEIVFGVPPIFFHGRGFLNYNYGILPYNRAVNTVVGVPINVERINEPSQEDIDNLHQKYIQSLIELFDENKERFGIDRNVHLRII